MKDKKKKPINYIIITIIFIVTLVAIISLRRVYIDYKEFNARNSVLSGNVAELHLQELDNYIRDNGDIVLYIGSSENYNSKEIEKSLLKRIKKDHLEDQIVYLNISEKENKVAFFKNFNEKYVDSEEKKIKASPALAIFKDRKVIASVSETESELKYSEIEKLLDIYEIAK